jgi:hypothetical protein
VADVKFAIRHSGRTPFATLTIVLVLAIGIGIDSVMFTMVHLYARRPPSGVEAAEDLVRIRGSQIAGVERVRRSLSFEEFEGIRALDGPFRAVAGWTSHAVTASAASDG